MTIRIPDETPILRIAMFAWQNGCDLYATRTGGIELRPRHSNVGRVKMKKNRFQRFKGMPTP